MNAGDPVRSGVGRPGFSHETFFTWLFGLSICFLLPVLLSAQISYQQGWPVEINGSYTSPIMIADIDDDGNKEIIFSDGSSGGQGDWWLYVKEFDGQDSSGWPLNYTGSESVPLLLDRDNDGKMEVVTTSAGLHMTNYDGSSLWSHPYDGPIFHSRCIPAYTSSADLDDDGTEEIVLTCVLDSSLYVFDTDGNLRPGWPVDAGGSYMSASIGDIDQDGMKEILVASSMLWCLKPDGMQCPGFPYDFPLSSRSKPVLVDVNGDNFLEIIFGNQDSYLRVLNHDGSLLSGYPIFRSTREISIGDIDRNGTLDMVIPFGYIYGYNIVSSNLLPNFPFSDPDVQFAFADSASLILDVNGDEAKEIVEGGYSSGLVWDGRLFSFDLNGQVTAGFPSDILYHRGLNSTCAADDLDVDGDIEICCGSENLEFYVPRSSTVYCWDIDHPYNLDNIDWAMDGFDLGHTGRWRKLYHIDKAGSTLSVAGCVTDPCYLPADGALHAVSVTAQRAHAPESPPGQDVRYSRTLGCGEYSGPVIDNGNGTYTRNLQAPSVECSTEVHAWVNEFKLNDSATIHFTNCNDPANLGDVDLDGDIDYTDKQLVQNFVDGLIELSGPEFCRGDVNGDMAVTDVDIALLNNCIRARCDQLPEPFKTSCRNHGNCFLGDVPRGFPYDRIDPNHPPLQ